MLGFSALGEAPLAALSGDAIRIESSTLLDSNFLLDSSLSLKYFPQQILNIDTSILSDSKVVSNISTELAARFDLSLSSLVQISNSTDLSSTFSVDGSAILKVISDALLQTNVDLSLASLVKTYAASDINILFNIDPVLSNTAFVSANLEILTILQADFSRVNGDIVYYVVYTDKIKPFNLTIARVK